ncbi:tetratricopeptide repeat-containing diguanylate cyclase [Paucibacter soli]|uniref:tetratricopeptide repeat-containing diguanylate cyclase n=1 Tax=Paucibacter soli TaxID=3133433 RepID=UPI0030B17302
MKSRGLCSELLARAEALANIGQAAQAVQLAEQALSLGQESGDIETQAQAMLCLSSCQLRLLGGYRQAHELAQRAALLFERCDLAADEALALCTHAIASTRLGHYEEAVESALLAVRLSEALPPGREQVMAHHALGVAAHSGRNYAEAERAFENAVAISRRCEPPLNTYELHINMALVAIADHANERRLGQTPTALPRLARHLDDAALSPHQAHELNAMAPGSLHALQVKATLARALHHCWRLDTTQAQAELNRLRDYESSFAQAWVSAAAHWCVAELALARGELAGAEGAARLMSACGQQARHEGFIQLGQSLVSYLCELQGRHREALEALRELSRHEQETRKQSLQNRAHVIDWQLQLRQHRRDVQQLEQLAMRDMLTGLPNRRHFEQHLRLLLLKEQRMPPCLALIDVDHFKQVNDNFSHGVGDAVLKALAQLLREHVRELDLPARLAGDEFVLLLVDAGLGRAQQVCERLQASVRAYDWGRLAPGLQLSISLGLAELRPGEGLEALLERSDADMYRAKRAR